MGRSRKNQPAACTARKNREAAHARRPSCERVDEAMVNGKHSPTPPEERTMNNKNRRIAAVSLFLCALLGLSSAFAAEPPDTGLKDTEALHGLKVAKAVYMLDVKEPGRMAHVLKVIEETNQSIAKQNVKPETIVVVIGPSVAFLTQDRRGISYMDQRAVSEVQGMLGKLKKAGARIEACGIALRGMDVKPGMLIPEVTAVGDGYISAIGYQAQGYQLVPVY